MISNAKRRFTQLMLFVASLGAGRAPAVTSHLTVRAWTAGLLVTLSLFAGAPGAHAGERLVFDSFVGTSGRWGVGGDFLFPAGIAIDSRGVVYVAAPSNHSVAIFDGSRVNGFNGVCRGPDPADCVDFGFPISVAVDPRNNDVWIADPTEHRVIKMNQSQQLLLVLGGQGTGPGQFESPVRVAVDQAGNLYVLDDGGRTCFVIASPRATSCTSVDANVRIQKFRSDGTFLRSWGSLCEALPFLDPATGIFTAGVHCNSAAPGAVVVGDGQFVFSHIGGVQNPHFEEGFQFTFVGMAVDSMGNVYVAEQDRVQKFDTNGVFLRKWGSTGSGDGDFLIAAGVAVDFADKVYVADFRNNRIQKFDGAGTFLTKVGSGGRGLGVFRDPAFVAAPPKDLVQFCQLLKLFEPRIQCEKIFVSEFEEQNLRVQALTVRQDRDGDSLVDEVDLDPTTFSDEAGLGDTGLHVLSRSGFPFVIYDPFAVGDTIRVTTETTGSATTFNVAPFCRNPNRPFGTLTVAEDNAFDFHCSTPTLDVLTGPIGWTFTGADGTIVTATLDDGASLSVDPTTSSIRANAGNVSLVVGGASIALGPGRTAFADTTAPSTSASRAPGANPNGWNKSDVSVTLTATDNTGGSGVKEISFSLSGAQAGASTNSGNVVSVPISANGVTTLTYFARDNASNAEAPKTLSVQVDKTPPTVTFGAPSPAANAAGWNNTDVSIAFTTGDGASGVDASKTTASPVTLTTEGSAVTATITVTDKAGNTATFTTPAMKIDKTPPTVGCVRVAEPRHDDDEKALFRVSASDALSQVTGVFLGGVSLTQGEIIQLQSTKKAGVHLVARDDDDRDDPRFKRFKLGPGTAVITAVDAAGNVGTAVCPLPSGQRDDGDHGTK